MSKIKCLLYIMALCTAIQCYGQRIERFQDSLTYGNKRSWFREDGARFTKVGENCPFGHEMVFFENEMKAEEYICLGGAWTKKTYKYRVSSQGGTHFVDLLNRKNKVIRRMEVQFVGSRGKYRTEITFFEISSKKYYTLISDKSHEAG